MLLPGKYDRVIHFSTIFQFSKFAVKVQVGRMVEALCAEFLLLPVDKHVGQLMAADVQGT